MANFGYQKLVAKWNILVASSLFNSQGSALGWLPDQLVGSCVGSEKTTEMVSDLRGLISGTPISGSGRLSLDE